MSKYTEEELNQALEDTGRLLQDVPLTREYDLDDILAEFGTGAVKPPQPVPEPVSRPQQPEPEDPAAEPAPKPESIAETPLPAQKIVSDERLSCSLFAEPATRYIQIQYLPFHRSSRKRTPGPRRRIPRSRRKKLRPGSAWCRWRI